jgi:predicted nucleotidyltransferase
LHALADWLAETAEAEEVILFGSSATGKKERPSDADFLVVLPPGTSKDVTDALLLRVAAFNDSSSLPIDLHPRTGQQLCEELQRGLPPLASNAMADGILFYPKDLDVSRYVAFADAWRLANHIRMWFYPARFDLSQALELRRAGLLDPGVIRLGRQAVDEALHALLIRAGGDIPTSEDPIELLSEIQALDGRLAEPLIQYRPALAELIKIAADTGTAPVRPQALPAALLVAATVVRRVGHLVRSALKPDVPCPAPSVR